MRQPPQRGDVWMVDLGLAAKVRPCLILTDYPADEDLALISVIAHTTTLRGNTWEIQINKSFLRKGAFHIQQVHSIPLATLERYMGKLSTDEMGLIHEKLKHRFAL